MRKLKPAALVIVILFLSLNLTSSKSITAIINLPRYTRELHNKADMRIHFFCLSTVFVIRVQCIESSFFTQNVLATLFFSRVSPSPTAAPQHPVNEQPGGVDVSSRPMAVPPGPSLQGSLQSLRRQSSSGSATEV